MEGRVGNRMMRVEVGVTGKTTRNLSNRDENQKPWIYKGDRFLNNRGYKKRLRLVKEVNLEDSLPEVTQWQWELVRENIMTLNKKILKN